MYKGKSIIAVIPARAGSKRLPNKNIRKLRGKPLIAHTIKQAKRSRYIDEVVVSTDSKRIAAIAKRYGASVPFMRPSRLASDSAKTVDVLLHVVDWYGARLRAYDVVVLLQPTSPLRNVSDIDKAIKLLFTKRALAIVSVCLAEHNPCWMDILPKNGSMKEYVKNKTLRKRSQDLPNYYRINGAVYVIYSEALRKMNDFYGDRTFAYVMPSERSVDIDSELDLSFAEYLAKKRW